MRNQAFVLGLGVFATLALLGSSCDGCGGHTPPAPGHRGDGCTADANCATGFKCEAVNQDRICADPNDVDGDGIANAVDPDIDGDGIPNAADPDIDGDGIPNNKPDGSPADPSPFGDNNADPNTCIGAFGDCDNDGIPNGVDNDDNNDGTPDGVTGPGSCDGGQTTVSDENADCDGYCITLEGGFQPCNDCPAGADPSFCAPPGAGVPDSDGDGIPDPLDPDPTGDGQQPPLVGEGEGEGEGEGQNCTTTTVNPGDQQLNPRILLVVDKSGSMNDDDLQGVRKWDSARNALETVAQGLDGSVDLGLSTFPDDGGGDSCAGAALQVNVGANNGGAITSVLNATEPSGGTPTAVSLLGAKSVLDQLPTAGGPRVVVIATDGGPNCNASLNGDTCRCVSGVQSDCQGGGEQNCLDDVNAINAAQQLNAAGYSVFVIGVHGSENFTDVLNSLAIAGGTDLPGTVKFYQGNQQSDLENDLQDIAIRVGACRIDLPQNVSAGQLTVTVNGAAVSQDTSRANGWDLTDPNTVELFGPPCLDTVNGGAAATVSVQVCDG